MAQAAQLTVMASGPKACFEACQDIFAAWGPKLFYLGEAEQSRLMTLVVNLLIVQTSAMLAEGLTLGRKGGLDWSQMWQVLAGSAVGSPIIKAKSAQLGKPLGRIHRKCTWSYLNRSELYGEHHPRVPQSPAKRL